MKLNNMRQGRGTFFNVQGFSRLERIPRSPGVYLFRDPEGRLLYVGKAKDLRSRLASYFRKGSDMPSKTLLMLKRAETFEIIVTPSEKDALILEASLIKDQHPRYNIQLRDDKAYPFVRLDVRAEFPRLGIVRRKKADNALYFGPYTSARAVRQVVRLVSSVFKLRTCTKKAMKNRHRPCIQYQIGRCSAPCTGMIDREDYLAQASKARLFLEGRSGHLIKELKEAMKKAAMALEFEKAACIRDQIYAIDKVLEKQTVVPGTTTKLDAIGIAASDETIFVSILEIRGGAVRGQYIRRFQAGIEREEGAVLSAVLTKLYHEILPPSQILVPMPPDDIDAIVPWLCDRVGRDVVLVCPSRGIKLRLVRMAVENARQAALATAREEESWHRLAIRLKDLLHLRKAPVTVEGIDISTTGGEVPVGSLVAFESGRPRKAGYRHYNIKSVEGMNDFAMISEVLRRRLKHASERMDLPDLFLIDGGRGQLSQAVSVLREEFPAMEPGLAAMAKPPGKEGDRIFLPDRSMPLCLPRHDQALLFLQRVRDEAHRFGIRFHRKMRNANAMVTDLVKIPGVGPARQRLLLRHFGSLTRVKQASVAQLEMVPGLPKPLAARIYEYFNRENVGT